MSEFNNVRFRVLDHSYMNTGGHIMVSVFSVYDQLNSVMRYMVANDEGFNWQSMDNISEELPADLDFDDICLMSKDWSALIGEPSMTPDDRLEEHDITADMFELFKYCQYEFYKEYCKTFNTRIHVHIDDLPSALLECWSRDAVYWHRDNDPDVTTDGFRAWPNPLYVPYNGLLNVDDDTFDKNDKELQQIKDFKQWLDETLHEALVNDTLQEFYDSTYTIVFNGRATQLPFDADVTDSILSLLDKVVDQW